MVLDGKSILVIGGGTIARGAVLELAKAGANLVIADLYREEAERIAEASRGCGAKAKATQADLGDPTSLAAAVELTLSSYGALDGLFQNGADTAVAREDFDLLSIKPETWERALKINLTGNFHAIRAALPVMLKQRRGAIVCTASDDAFIGAPVRVGYATSKLGILALIRHVASRWGKEGIRANAICPGLVPHEEIESAFGKSVAEFHAEFLARTPSPRLGKPKDIGAMVRFLLSDDAEWINGQSMSVDGGLAMR